MSRKARIIIFSFLAFSFILVAPCLILYLQGYRIDLETQKIVRTGAFYFRVQPAPEEVYINKKLKKKIGGLFFNKNIFIENLLPKKYDVEIRKQGYYPWQKHLEVEQLKVTEAKNVILIPKHPEFKLLAKNVENFFFSPDKKKFVTKEVEQNIPQLTLPIKTGQGASSTTNKNIKQKWALKLFNRQSGVKSLLLKEEQISKTGVDLFELTFSPDANRILLKLGLKEQLKYFILDLRQSPPRLIPLDFLGPEAEQVRFNPSEPRKLFLIKRRGQAAELYSVTVLYSTNYAMVLNQQQISDNVIIYKVFDKYIIWLDGNGFVKKSGFDGSNIETLNAEPLSIKKEARYQIMGSYSFLLIKQGDVLYFLDSHYRQFKKFSRPVKFFKFSPDSRKLALTDGHEVWILFLKAQNSQPQKKLLEQELLVRFSKEIKQLFWYSNYYVGFVIEDGNAFSKKNQRQIKLAPLTAKKWCQIKISEIDDRDKVNIVTLSEFSNPTLYSDQHNRELYILSEDKLYSSKKLY